VSKMFRTIDRILELFFEQDLHLVLRYVSPLPNISQYPHRLQPSFHNLNLRAFASWVVILKYLWFTYVSPRPLSAFAKLVLEEGSVRTYSELMFEAVVKFKWHTFAKYYYYSIMLIYIIYASVFILGVSLASLPLTYPAIQITIIVIASLFLMGE